MKRKLTRFQLKFLLLCASQEDRLRHFFVRPKDLKLCNPNLQTVSIEQRLLTEIDFTTTDNNPTLFVWLDISNEMNGYFFQNGFHMFEQKITVTYTPWSFLINFDNNLLWNI
jgi:hypothetical protein